MREVFPTEDLSKQIQEIAKILNINKSNDLEKLISIKEAIQKPKNNITLNVVKLDQKFNTFVINANTVETLYRDFFADKQMPPGTT